MRFSALILFSSFMLAACQAASPVSGPSAFRSHKFPAPSFHVSAPSPVEPEVIMATAAPVISVQMINLAPLPAPEVTAAQEDILEIADAFTPIPASYEGFGEAVSGEELGEVRGTFAPDQGILGLLDAINANNNSTGSVTGNNVVSSAALTNNSGLVSIVQNSGNNVIIQNATLVNLSLQ